MKRKLFYFALIILALVGACSNPFFPEKPDNGGLNKNISVTGVSINKTTLILDIGGTETLIATVVPANATNKAVIWSSSDVAVATVSNGVVTAVSGGTAKITVTTAVDGKAVACAVTVSGPQTVTFTVIDGEGTGYTLEITGDDYVLTITENGGSKKTSTGKVAGKDGNTYTLAPDADPDETFDITVDEDGITDLEGTITFDDRSKKEPPVIVTSVHIINAALTVTPPAKGGKPVSTVSTDDDGYTCGTVTWSPAVINTFMGNTKYTATVKLTVKENFVFASGFTAAINGFDAVVTDNTGENVTISLEFDRTLALTVTGIAIKIQPTKPSYTHGETLDLSGLEVRLAFDDGTSEDIALADFGTNITTVPVNNAPLSHMDHNGKPVVVSFGGLTVETDNLTVNPKTISFTVDTIQAQTYTGSALMPTVTVKDNTTILTLTADYTAVYNNNTNVGTAAVTITGAGNYAGSSGSTTFTVNKANPIVTWPTGLTATYGQTLSDISLASYTNGGGTAGSFSWVTPTDSVGDLGTRSHNMTFTPSDTTNFNTLTRNVDITVLLGMEMVSVTGGSFQMGDTKGEGYSDEQPVHTVTLTGFYIGKYEVTQAQYQTVMGTNPSNSYGVGYNFPVYYVSWYDALVFCNKLSVAQGLTPAYRINNSTDPASWGSVPTSNNSSTWDAVEVVSGSTGYRLPTEAQWEYAAKGGNGSPGNYTYSGSNTVGDVAWYWDNIPSQSSGSAGYGTQPVGTKSPNGLGIYDMSGNVYEWCWDWYGSYSSDAQNNPGGAVSGTNRVSRGGYWYISATYVRSAHRYGDYPCHRGSSIGFRLVRP